MISPGLCRSVYQLRLLLHKLKGRSGLNDIYQSSKTILNIKSLQNYICFARNDHLNEDQARSNLRTSSTQDIHLLGVIKLTEDSLNGHLDQFHWPIGGIYHDSELIHEGGQGVNDFEIDPELIDWVEAD